MLEKVGGEGQYICDFGERMVHAIKPYFLQKVSALLMRVYC